MSLSEELAKLRRDLSVRAALGDQLGAKREMEHFISFRSLREVTQCAEHLGRAGWQADRTEGQDANSRFLLRAYREQSLDIENAERALREIYAITEKHGGSYDGFGAVFVPLEGSEPRGFFSRLFGNS